MNCTIVITSGPCKSQLCERPVIHNQSICLMHLNLQNLKNQKKTWDTLSKPKQKKFSLEIEAIVEKGTWRENILQLVTRYQLQDFFPKTEIECCLKAFRISHPNRSITYKKEIMYASDVHKGRCIKVKENEAVDLTIEEWKRLVETLPKPTQLLFIEDMQEIEKEDIDALLYHYHIPTTSFLWNEKAIQIIRRLFQKNPYQKL